MALLAALLSCIPCPVGTVETREFDLEAAEMEALLNDTGVGDSAETGVTGESGCDTYCRANAAMQVVHSCTIDQPTRRLTCTGEVAYNCM